MPLPPALTARAAPAALEKAAEARRAARRGEGEAQGGLDWRSQELFDQGDARRRRSPSSRSSACSSRCPASARCRRAGSWPSSTSARAAGCAASAATSATGCSPPQDRPQRLTAIAGVPCSSCSPARRGSARAPSSHELREREPELWCVGLGDHPAARGPARSTGVDYRFVDPRRVRGACATPAASSSGSRSTATSRARPAEPVEDAPGRRRRRRCSRSTCRARWRSGSSSPTRCSSSCRPPSREEQAAGGCAARGDRRRPSDAGAPARRRPRPRRPWPTASTPSW